ncbi:nucleotidyltransferase domain-containing protein [candidate division KSB1 bacterium]|nr:MAG: nucleotidyltransferase domain-containing protein [candidate division KSB1 bacterium]
MEKEVEIAKQIIVEEINKFGLEVKMFFLFGSRVKGNYTKDSDWDFYIIVDKDLDFAHKRKLNAQIRRRLAELRIPNDIIIQSESVAEKRKNDVGYLIYYVLKEGVRIL